MTVQACQCLPCGVKSSMKTGEASMKPQRTRKKAKGIYSGKNLLAAKERKERRKF